jgi:hypothetical protein
MAVESHVDVPRPITPGPEMQALGRFFRDATWTRRIAESGMGPGTPAMIARGSGVHELIQDGRWIVGNYEQDQLLNDGTFVLRWELHWVVGWDPNNREYRATLADNYGHADVMRGSIEGDRLVFESFHEAPARLRLTWDASDDSAIFWRNEIAVGDGSFTLVEEYLCTPLEPGPRP